MSDLISRQAAIEALYDWEMTYDWDDHCRKEDPKPAYIVSPSDVIEELSSAQPEQWIPCSERLPEGYGEYLITWETSKAPTRFIGFAEGEETGVWDDQYERFVFSWLPEDYIIERYPDWRVIAWMPLPEPYKGEQE